MTNTSLFGKNIEPSINQINISDKKVTISNQQFSTFDDPTISNNNVQIEVKAESTIEENCD